MKTTPPRAETPFPADEHDRLLLERVRPEHWENPRPADRYDLMVVGAGTGGLVTAAIATALGARVALVERGMMGGDCLNVGCVPSKALIRAASGWKEGRRANREMGGPALSGEGDFPAAMRRLREIRASIAAHDSAARFRDLGVDVFLGEGRFTAGDRLEVDGRALRFRSAVVATGGRPAIPDVPGLGEAGYLTNETIFSLASLPHSLVVIGGGPIGCELAQSFARFGSRVTILEAGTSILGQDDSDAARVVRDALTADGVRVVTDARIERVEAGDGSRVRLRFRRDGRDETAEGDEILVAAGREPNLESLRLDAAGVETNREGIRVDDRLRTTNRRVHAIGDVASPLHFTHLADAHARLVVRNALFPGRGGRVSGLVVPRVTFTDPTLAHVQAGHAPIAGRGLRTLTTPFAELDRARIDGFTEGFLRLHLRGRSSTIVAATVVGPGAAEIASHLTTAIRMQIGLSSLGETIFPYPTFSEIIRRAADQDRRGNLTPAVKKAFRAFFDVGRALRP